MTGSYRIGVIRGDGTGPEVVGEALKVFESVRSRHGFGATLVEFDLGADRFLRTGEVLPGEELDRLRGMDAILLGAVGDPRVKPGILERDLLLKVRLELDNPDLALRPDMFVDVALSVDLPPGLAVPADAIVDSGLAKLVFVQTAAGSFEPRRVETGWRAGDRVEVVKGLAAGEKIVTSGTFFLDSETRLRSPTSGAAAANDLAPVPTGHEPRPPGGAGLTPDAPPVKMPHPEEHRGDTGHPGPAAHPAHGDAAEAAQARADDAR